MPTEKLNRAMGSHHSQRSETCVWLTPREIIEALGPFDLDPCACSDPRPWPTAKRHFTAENNGLNLPWIGRIWLNPPYGPPAIIGPWMRRMSAHNHGTALIFARTETALFFETVWQSATAVLFIEGRLHFHYPDGRRAKANAGAPSVLVAYGQADAVKLRESEIPGHYMTIEREKERTCAFSLFADAAD